MSSESADTRRKRMTTAVSIFNRLSGASASMRSRGSSMLSKFQREMMGFSDSDNIKCRDWLFALVEFLLAFSWNCFGAREKSEETMAVRGVTPRQDTMDTLFWLGMASFANVIVGQLMDSLTGYYLMALLNIVMHFSLASLFLISEIVHATSSEDVYASLLSHVYLWAFFPIKALGFSRYVYAMDQVGLGKGPAFIIHYTFMFNLFNLFGNFIFFIVQDSAPSSGLMIAIALCFNGTVLFLYAYLLRPRPRLSVPPPAGSAIKIWGVLFTALRNKRKFGGKVKRQEWLDYAENRYDKAQIARSRRIFRLFLMTSPTAGFLLFTTYQGIIFKEFYDNLNFTGPGVPKFIKWMLPISSLLVVIVVEYALLPSLRACKFKCNFMKRFLLGYVTMLLAVTAAAIVSTITEKVPVRPDSGTFRVYNTMEGNVSFESVQAEFTTLQFKVLKNNVFKVNFAAKEQILFRMKVTFTSPTVGDEMIGNNTSYTQMFTVAPEEVLQYVAIAPYTLIRVPGFLPIKEGPPGKMFKSVKDQSFMENLLVFNKLANLGMNDGGKPRCFIVSLIGDRVQSVFVINDKTEERTTFTVGPGRVEMFQVQEGNYTLTYATSISQRTTLMLEAGGLYGIYLFLGLNEYEIEVDKIVPENTNHALWGLLVVIPMGLAKVFGQVSLDAFIYFTAPDGLKGLAYGFYLLCIHLTAWFILLGFHTWHHYITPNIILVYALIALVTFFFCLVLLIRYRNHYIM